MRRGKSRREEGEVSEREEQGSIIDRLIDRHKKRTGERTGEVSRREEGGD